jgi:GTP-binding protein EngB required for normal cell division
MAMDNDAERLARILDRPEYVTVCFLGHSGIGKSTLLNAIAANEEQVLPSGGIGPLTAQATEVHFSDTPCFSVHYHKRTHLWRIGFALEREYARATGEEANSSSTNSDETLDASVRREIEEEANGHEDGNGAAGTFRKQAAQVVAGDQFADRPLTYLVDCVRIACGYEAKWGTNIEDQDAVRINLLRRALDLADAETPYEHHRGADAPTFAKDLHNHAAGFLAPLIRSISVGWPSEVLRAGVRLVDLPGVGIAQDAYRRVTRSYIRERARAVILVVDRAGPTAEAVELLRTSGYWDRLVGAADDPDSDPCSLIIAVTKVDDVANEEYRNEAAGLPGARRKKRDIYDSLVEEFRTRMRRQVSDQLGVIGLSANETVSSARVAARDRILNTLEIHPVSAPEYRKILLDDEDDRPFLNSKEATGLPTVQKRLILLAQSERTIREQQLLEVADRLRNEIRLELDRLEALWLEQTRVASEIERVEKELDAVLDPKRKERDLRVGAFREFLEATAQIRIRELVLEAREVAEQEVGTYLSGLRNAHWATLRAAVRRGGAFDGSRAINLPDDIAGKFQEPTAAVWSVKLLKEIRRRTQEFATDQMTLVEEVCIWANERIESATAQLMRNQQKRIQRRAAQMQDVGKEAVADLRKVVKQTLSDAIEKPIRSACDKFVQDGNDIGPGVKSRILNLFDDLARRSTKAAQEPAIRILQDNFQAVRNDIRQAFDGWGDPLDDTANIIIQRQSEKVSREDAVRRSQVIEGISKVRNTDPQEIGIGG